MDVGVRLYRWWPRDPTATSQGGEGREVVRAGSRPTKPLSYSKYKRYW